MAEFRQVPADATTGQNGLAQAREFGDATEVTGVVLTKLDGSAKGGIVIAIQSQLGIPVKLVGLGETINDLVDAWKADSPTFGIINFANPDMVGHTGDLAAAIQATEAVDVAVGQVSSAVQAAGGALLITADHGNVEMMRDPVTGQPHTAHTVGPVPLIYVGDRDAPLRAGGSLRDVAPTLLDLLRLPRPAEMSGHSLFDRG